MGTKHDPGKYDCYESAEPDEPMFVLLARDPLAPALVEAWAALRGKDTEKSARKADEAVACAEAMRAWRRSND